MLESVSSASRITDCTTTYRQRDYYHAARLQVDLSYNSKIVCRQARQARHTYDSSNQSATLSEPWHRLDLG